MHLILASTSQYRARLLARLHLPFTQIDPLFPETGSAGETPDQMARRLAEGKARAAAEQSLAAPWLLIASDQVASLGDLVFGKPGDHKTAAEQLAMCSGRWVSFDTAICLLSSDGYQDLQCERFEIRFRPLDERMITRYLNLDRPFDSAGSIKAESHGNLLIEDSRGRDFNTLLGLPLMLLQDMLIRAGVDPLKSDDV
ncbi:MAG: Maf family protein [Pseudomonadota bacterium]